MTRWKCGDRTLYSTLKGSVRERNKLAYGKIAHLLIMNCSGLERATCQCRRPVSGISLYMQGQSVGGHALTAPWLDRVWQPQCSHSMCHDLAVTLIPTVLKWITFWVSTRVGGKMKRKFWNWSTSMLFSYFFHYFCWSCDAVMFYSAVLQRFRKTELKQDQCCLGVSFKQLSKMSSVNCEAEWITEAGNEVS